MTRTVPPRALSARRVEKVWGRDELPPPFAGGRTGKEDGRIGEIWFEPQPPWDGLLAKYLFTSEKLSVQVHPDDARAPGGSGGKDECWLVLDAEPDACLALGFVAPVDSETMREAALNGSIEERLAWFPAKRGDFIYLPAGTVHAIGPGLSLVEIQQNCDITYRLFDYGRPRALHLDAGLAVAHGQPHDAALRYNADLSASQRLVDGPKFTLDLCLATDPLPPVTGRALVLPLDGAVRQGAVRVTAGGCLAASDLADVTLSSDARVLIAAETAKKGRAA